MIEKDKDNCYGCATQRHPCEHDAPTPSWRKKPLTEKQETALFNIRFALGYKGDALHKMPANRGAASDEIRRLKEIVQNNLSIGGSINPAKSVYGNDADWGIDE